MAGRYDASTYAPKLDSFRAADAYTPPPQKKNDPLADFLKFAGGVAPAVGTGLGAGVGGLLGAAAGGVGAIPGAAAGAALGGAAGTLAGGAANYGADQMGKQAQLDADKQNAALDERKAREQAAMQLMSSWR